ncbi:hypothetical protein [Haloplanus halophilus]|uniref:hypothetical protein n=1 Tax=Haloplanus halophilus TaxID=2949993 RepID=UPI00203F7C6F|nr:hypothetical protein [Haloplanus sp. GDY1]
MTDDAPAEEGEDSSRRRLLALFGAVLLAVVGAGTGGSNPLAGDDDEVSGPNLSVEYRVTPDRPVPTPTPTPGGGDGAGATGPTRPPSDDATAPPSDDATTPPSDDATDDATPDGDRSVDGGDRPVRVASAPSSELIASAIPPVSLADVSPGDGGVVDLSLSLSGTPARLFVRGTATDFEEGGVTEAERPDDDSAGELQAHVRVRLWYDADRDGAVGAGDRLIYEGPLAGLDAVSGWTPLTDACVGPGTHTVRFRWDLPADAPNVVQTDSASFSLGVAADASECA